MIPKWRIVMSPALVLVILITIFFVLSAGCGETKLPTDLHVYKTDESGMVQWSTKINQEPNEYGRMLVERPDKNLIVGSKRAIIALVSPSGEVNHTSGPDDLVLLNSIGTRDGGRLVYGKNVTKLRADGTLDWVRPINYTTRVIQLTNGNYLLDHWDLGARDISIICLAPDGATRWDKSTGIRTGYEVSAMYESPDHSIEVTTQYTVEVPGGKYPQLMRSRLLIFNPEGNLVGEKTINAVGPMTRTPTGEYVFSAFPLSGDLGYTMDYSNDGKPLLVKLDPEGIRVWDKPLTVSRQCTPLSIIQTSDGGYAVLLVVDK